MPIRFFKSPDNYGTELNGYDVMKLVAITTMLISHTGMYLFPEHLWMRAIGRITFPLFFFMIGYSGIFRFNWALILAALLLSALDLLLNMPIVPLNIFYTILLTRYAMHWIAKKQWLETHPWEIFLICAFAAPLARLAMGYGTLGILLAACGYLQYKKRPSRHFFIAATLLYYGAISQMSYDFMGMDLVLLCSGMLFLMACFYRFSPDIFPYQPTQTISKPLRLCARNPLIYYMAHITVLKLWGKILYPARHAGWIGF